MKAKTKGPISWFKSISSLTTNTRRIIPNTRRVPGCQDGDVDRLFRFEFMHDFSYRTITLLTSKDIYNYQPFSKSVRFYIIWLIEQINYASTRRGITSYRRLLPTNDLLYAPPLQSLYFANLVSITISIALQSRRNK